MYNGKIKVFVTYHFNDDKNAETVLEAKVEKESEAWKLLDQVWPDNFWRGDDGECVSDWPEDTKPSEGYDGMFYQTVAYPLYNEHSRYFLAVFTPAE